MVPLVATEFSSSYTAGEPEVESELANFWSTPTERPI